MWIWKPDVSDKTRSIAKSELIKSVIDYLDNDNNTGSVNVDMKTMLVLVKLIFDAANLITINTEDAAGTKVTTASPINITIASK